MATGALSKVSRGMTDVQVIPIDQIEFVKELYPRLREDDAAIERYRAAIDKLPPIVVARGRLLVDGFHRWQAHKREGATDIAVVDLGNLADLEIRKESLQRNATHGRQLETSDKRRQAGELYLLGVAEPELIELLSVTPATLKKYLEDAKATEKQRQQEAAWDLWLDCHDYRSIAKVIDGPNEDTIGRWVSAKTNEFANADAPDSRQHFDIWSFPSSDSDTHYFGAMPPQVVENLLWFFTEPGQIVVDPFAGAGTTIDVAKRMGRRVWASDRKPFTPTLPIHEHDITAGWPKSAPAKADFILLDPPYWKQAAGRYSDDPTDLGNMALDAFMAAWTAAVKHCAKHLADGGRLAFIVSPAEDKDADRVVDLALLMYEACCQAGFSVTRRIVVPYQTQQATGQQVTWAREHKRMLKLYRDLLVMVR